VALPKTTRKKKPRAPARKKTGQTQFSFEGWQDWDGPTYHRFVQAARQDIYEQYKATDLVQDIYYWMKENGYSKTDITAAKKAPNHGVHTLGISCKLLNMGMPDYNKKHDEYWQSLAGTTGELKPTSDWVKNKVAELIEKGKVVVEEVKAEEKAKKNVYVPTIQERLKEQAFIQAEAIDEWLEGWVRDPKTFDPKGFNFKKHFQELNVTQAHARKLKAFYAHELEDYDELERMPTAGQLKKMSDHDADMWLQLKEGYAHLVKSDITKFRTAINELMAALDFVIDAAKATRKPRKPKVRSASKVVEKLKFLKVDEKFKLASIVQIKLLEQASFGCLMLRHVSSEGMLLKTLTLQDKTEAIQDLVLKVQLSLVSMKQKVSKRHYVSQMYSSKSLKMPARLNYASS